MTETLDKGLLIRGKTKDKFVKNDFQDQGIYELFQKQAKLFPNNLAVKFDNDELNYFELNRFVKNFAKYLKAIGVEKKHFVGIFLDFSLEMVVSILAVLKTGAAYVPIDVSYPDERCNYMLKNADVSLVITIKENQSRLSSTIKQLCLRLKDFDKNDLKEKDNSLNHIISPDDIIYLLYTSGTTGLPKGTLLFHRGVANLLHWYIRSNDITPHDKVLIISSFGFDLTHKNILGSLLAGATVYITTLTPYDPRRLARLIAKHRITFINCTPSTFYPILEESTNEELNSLRLIFLGGEHINTSIIRNYNTHIPKAKIINTYGPTECSDLACSYTLSHEDILNEREVPVGSPLPNVELLILDQELRCLPKGEVGEICIGGEGVGGGYLNNPELTASKFINNPYFHLFPESGKKLYRTGDVGKWLENGLLKCIGRADDQIKINGQRIEIKEIEQIILAQQGVKQAVVLAHNVDHVIKSLNAYLITESNVNITLIRRKLSALLPTYMLPSHFFVLDNYPISLNGKLDKIELKKIGESYYKTNEFIHPKTYEEQALIEIWSDVLKQEPYKISMHANFFELGGYSLLVTRVNLRIKEIFKVDLSIKNFFENPSISQLAKILIRKNKNKETRILPKISSTSLREYSLSTSQDRIFFLHKLLPESGFNNLPVAYLIEGKLDINVFQRALEALITRHSSLRTQFFDNINGTYQVVSEVYPIEEIIEIIDLSSMSAHDKYKIAQKTINNDANKSFNLSEEMPINVKILLLSNNEYIVYFNINHIVFDGWSWSIFKRELSNLYNYFKTSSKLTLPKIEIQYIDYAHWQRTILKTDYLSTLQNFWIKLLKDIPQSIFPTDYPRSSNMNFRGRRLEINLPEEYIKNLKDIARSNNTTYFVILISIFSSILYGYAGRRKELIAIPFANRINEQLEALIGCFINTIVFPVEFDQNLTLRKLIQVNTQTTIDLLGNQDFPFELLVNDLNIQRDPRINPISQVMFAFQNAEDASLTFGDTKITPFQITTQYSRFDLEWQVWYEGEQLRLDIFFKDDLFKEETIKNFVHIFCSILSQLRKKLDVSLNEILTPNKNNRKLSISIGSELQPLTLLPYKLKEHVFKYANKIAVIHKNVKLTYSHLNDITNQFANFLKNKNVKFGDRIAILLEGSIYSLISMLASMKIGAIFVPLNISYPENYLEKIIKDCDPACIISQKNLIQETLRKKFSKILWLEEFQENTAKFSVEATTINHSLNIPSYIIYTSGTTGTPKGVLISLKSLSNILLSFAQTIGFDCEGHILSITPPSFDIALLELFMPLMMGGTVTIAISQPIDPIYILRMLINNESINFLQTTPTIWKMFLDTGWRPRKNLNLISGGEALTPAIAKYLLSTGATLWNAYGPTEATIWSLACKIMNSENIPIGKPLNGTRCYVLDEAGMIMPQGSRGELYIAGEGVAIEYWQTNELTKDKFVELTLPNNKIDRCYVTGDLVSYNEDVGFYFHGRSDEQIKLHGHRIEAEEIKQVVEQHPWISQAAVIAQNNENTVSLKLFACLIQPFKQDFYRSIVDHWRKVFDSVYLSATSTDSEFIGWLNSYTRSPFSLQEMKDWIKTTVMMIAPFSRGSILEIGSGGGALVNYLLPTCKNYTVIEASKNAVELLNEKFKNNSIVSVRYLKAHEIKYINLDSFNLIILNSVIQYFPAVSYLEEVLFQLADKLSDESALYIGDIRSPELSESFYRSLPNRNKQIEGSDSNNELLLEPYYIYQIIQKVLNSCQIEIIPKIGKYSNELNRFRYDVLCHKKSSRHTLFPKKTYEFEKNNYLAKKWLKTKIKRDNEYPILITNIPNSYLLEGANNKTASLFPWEILEIAKKNNIGVKLRLCASSSKLFDAVFYHIETFTREPIFPFQSDGSENKKLFKNPSINVVIEEEIINYLSSHLPSHMLPEEINILEKLPFTPHGKIDKKNLSSHKRTFCAKKLASSYLNMSSGAEEIIQIWRNFLKVEFIELDDNFFNLGGNSFKALQLNNQVNTAFGINLPVSQLYTYPTLAKHIEAVMGLLDTSKNSSTFLNSNQNYLNKLQVNNKPILFILPPLDGNIEWYEHLVKALEKSIICFALDHSTYLTTESIISVEEMASIYIRIMQDIQKKGPYKLLGWSFGGLVAFEMALQLKKKNELHTAPVLIDAPAPEESEMIINAKNSISRLQQYDPNHPDYRLKQFGADNSLIHNSRIYIEYKPKAQLEEVFLIDTEKNLQMRWQKYSFCQERYVIHEANHYSIMNEPYVQYVANLVKSFLDNSH